MMAGGGGAQGTEFTLDVPRRAPIVERITSARRRARVLFRIQFAAVWLILITLIVVGLYAGGRIEPDWLGRNAPFILGGIGITILVSIASIVLATFMALIGALGRLSTNAIVYAVSSFYVSLVRGTPLLVQIYIVFFALPQLGIVLDPIPSGIVALGFNYGAYMTEIFRAGIQAVPHGQVEAAHAVGMPDRLIFRRIVLPQAVRIVIPAVGNEFIAMIKDSSLVSVITVQELLWRARNVGTRDARSIQAFLVAALVYWILTIIFSIFQERLERRLARSDR
ncbi:MAG TPA: amino acid ABC transporter permease [Candidatus Limnocylindria bacterium]|nr:amino acid ABC transporter permease [Candidatus Limnocylindria bacterium]